MRRPAFLRGVDGHLILAVLACLLIPQCALSQGLFVAPAAVGHAPQSAELTLDAGGNATWTFSPAFDAVPAVSHMPRSTDATQPIVCNYTAKTTTAVSIHCWKAANVTVAALGTVLNAFGGSVLGEKVTLIARQIP